MDCWRVLGMVLTGVWIAGCVSTPKVASYLAGNSSERFLTGPRTVSENTETIRQELERFFLLEGLEVSVFPLTQPFLRALYLDDAYRRRQETAEAEKRALEVWGLMKDRLCYHVQVRSQTYDGARLEFLHLEASDPFNHRQKLVYTEMTPPWRVGDPLTNLGPEGFLGSLNRTLRLSYGTPVRLATAIYENASIGCTASSFDTTRGFAVRVEPRYQRNLSPQGLYWNWTTEMPRETILH